MDSLTEEQKQVLNLPTFESSHTDAHHENDSKTVANEQYDYLEQTGSTTYGDVGFS